MDPFDLIMARIYEGIAEPIDDDAIRLILILPGVAAFFQDYYADGIWASVDAIKAANLKTDSKEDWLKCLYAEVAVLFNDQPMSGKVTIIQQAMLISIIVQTYEVQEEITRDNMRIAMLLVNPPPASDAIRYYICGRDVHKCRALIETFLSRKGATLQ